jgi:hypothetical protein
MHTKLTTACAVLALLVFGGRAGAQTVDDDGGSTQVVNPANGGGGSQEAPKTDHPRTWEMPPVDVYGKAPLSEDDRIGDYAQPRWTADRLFSETRVYVIPKGKVEFEYWSIPETSRDGSTETANMYEAEFGLPGRFQLDLYAVSHKESGSGPMSFDEQKVEVRYAFADWNKIWGNPTLYVEYTSHNDDYSQLEGKILLGGNITSGWHWGSNLVLEHTLGGNQENSNEWTLGISHTLRDRKFALGAETQVVVLNGLDPISRARDVLAKEFLLGPSIQVRPLPQMHIDVASLFGTTGDSPRSKVFVVLGYEF